MAGGRASAPPPGGRVCIVGAGFMGCVIATLYARHGYDVVICDTQPAMLESFVQRARPIAASFSDDSAEIDAMVSRVHTEPSLEDAVSGTFMVHEAVQEVLATKQAVFEELDRLCPPEVVLATNTSSFLISDIAANGPAATESEAATRPVPDFEGQLDPVQPAGSNVGED